MLTIKNLSVSYSSKSILKDINLQFPSKGLVSIIGENGAGKTTLFSAMVKAISYSGEIFFLKENIQKIKLKEYAKIISLIPQKVHFNFSYKVLDIILMAKNPYLKLFSNYIEEDIFKVEQILNNLKIPLGRLFNQLSEGEKQKVLFERVFFQNSKIILIDEGISNLDIKHQIEIMTKLKKLAEEKLIILISHNLNLSFAYSDFFVFLKDGKVTELANLSQIDLKSTLIKVFDTDKIKLNYINNKPYLSYE